MKCRPQTLLFSLFGLFCSVWGEGDGVAVRVPASQGKGLKLIPIPCQMLDEYSHQPGMPALEGKKPENPRACQTSLTLRVSSGCDCGALPQQ